jgi:magnesium chelatase family protein
MDRIDIFVEVPPVEYEKLVDEGHAEDSAQVWERVKRARELQQGRF